VKSVARGIMEARHASYARYPPGYYDETDLLLMSQIASEEATMKRKKVLRSKVKAKIKTKVEEILEEVLVRLGQIEDGVAELKQKLGTGPTDDQVQAPAQPEEQPPAGAETN
jgi:hypothetical protein